MLFLELSSWLNSVCLCFFYLLNVVSPRMVFLDEFRLVHIVCKFMFMLLYRWRLLFRNILLGSIFDFLKNKKNYVNKINVSRSKFNKYLLLYLYYFLLIWWSGVIYLMNFSLTHRERERERETELEHENFILQGL